MYSELRPPPSQAPPRSPLQRQPRAHPRTDPGYPRSPSMNGFLHRPAPTDLPIRPRPPTFGALARATFAHPPFRTINI